MNSCDTCSLNCSDKSQCSVDTKKKLNEHSSVSRTIGVISGKGGVGKSLVTSLLSIYMQRRGFNTAILDGDITGPSIPKVLGVKDRAYANEYGAIPGETSTGIKIMSSNMILENDTDPLVYRGPVIANMVEQFWTDVNWGHIDYMFVDMPPGTGDVPLTVFQSLPVDGIVIVTSPQDLVSMVVGKSIKMAKLMKVPILGIVENMSYASCPDCGKELNIFGESKIDKIAKEYDIEVYDRLPINPKISSLSDKGRLEDIEDEYLINTLDEISKL